MNRMDVKRGFDLEIDVVIEDLERNSRSDLE